ncbi:MDR family MFS transporter [Rhodoluna sp.]|uniref:MDR family MFS transporter n=1 Tax=Rhodoluna sp. TaxID=1969481 RepID=UPI0025FDE675|nr:MDR family MFS transporter [Rhodoluna sp.]
MARAERKAAAAESAKTGVMTHRQIMLVLAGLMSGMFLSALDQSVVGSAMRTIADDLQGLELQAWATTAYLITSTITTPLYGKLGDIFGRRRLFIFAIIVFVVGSVAGAFSNSMFELAAWRAFQGIGAGGLFTLSLTILADIVPPRERARYQGMFMAVFGTSSVLGPLIGGLFADIDTFLFIDGWRWIFLINLPIGIVALLMVVAFLHVPHTARKSRIDWWGAAAIIVAVVPLLLVAENGRDWGWDSSSSIALYVTGAIGIVAFILIERKMGTDAILPLHLFKSRTFSMTTIMGVIVGVGMFGGMMTIPLILQIVDGASPTEAGLLMIPMTIGMMTASMGSGIITGRTGKYKIFMIGGTGLMTISYIYFGQMTYDWEVWQISIGMVVLGLGLGQLMQTLTVAAQNSVEAANIGVATSSSTFFRQMGGTAGVAVFLSILFATLADKGTWIGEQIAAVLKAKPELMSLPENAVLTQAGPGGLSDLVAKDSSFLQTISPEISEPILVAFTQAGVVVFNSAAAVIAVAFVLSWFVKEIPLRTQSGVAAKAAEARLESMG